jgi:ubiquinol-cytochrome c reductase cytochrome b subunit
MISKTLHWLDDRTGYRALVRETLYERVPGGARWRYVWGSTLAFAFFVQLVTGLVLWMHYSPSTQTAWESVYYIEFTMTGGWWLRGIHHYMAQAMIVLMALHLMQVVVDGAYRAPREINFLLGLLLMLVVFGLGLTGYLLPWDQKGYWATQVATKIVGLTPLVGNDLKTLLVGGSQYGHLTLTRFFALHAGVLPGALIGLLVLHLAMFRKYGITPKEPRRAPDCDFWPDQVLRDAVACLAVLVVVCFLTANFRAELGAPADPAVAYNAARPEWYYLFLFQFLKLFRGETGELLGAIVFPGLVFGLMCLMPFFGRWNLGHRFNVGFLLALLLGAAGLTAAALNEDFNGQTAKSQQHIEAVALAHAEAERAHALAAEGIPPAGALSLVRDDPGIAGRRLFERHCASCHRHTSTDELDPLRNVDADNASAANLYGFGRPAWVAGLLDIEQLRGEHYFGNTVLADGEMALWIEGNIAAVRDELEGEQLAEYNGQLAAVAAAVAAESGRPVDETDAELVAEGRRLIVEEMGCIDCHKFGDDGELGMAPDLTGYASREWLIEFLNDPTTDRFYLADNYGEPARMMPAFAPHRDEPVMNVLTDREIELIVDWLRGKWATSTLSE